MSSTPSLNYLDLPGITSPQFANHKSPSPSSPTVNLMTKALDKVASASAFIKLQTENANLKIKIKELNRIISMSQLSMGDIACQTLCVANGVGELTIFQVNTPK